MGTAAAGAAISPRSKGALQDEEELVEGSESSAPVSERLLWLYLFAFWSQFKPSEPFLVDYLVEEKGINSQQVYQSVFDLFVYTRLPFVALVGLVAEMNCFGCRAVLVLGAICGVVTVLITRFSASVLLQQVAQCSISASFASRIAVPSVAFALSLPSQFQEAIHTLKAVMLLSNCLAAALGELLRDSAGVPLNLLFDISSWGQVVSLVCAACLPATRVRHTCSTPTSTAIANTLEQHLITPKTASEGRSSELVRSFKDLWLSLWLPRVMWWTAWALAMNPIHGLTLTYWQSIVRSKQIFKDHNGYLSASMYFASSVLTYLSRDFPTLQNWTPGLVIISLLVAGGVLLELAAASTSRQVTVYTWIFLYQCLFEVTTAVATFQVGAEVTRATAASHSKALRSCQVRRLPRCARLTLLFSATTVLAAANEAVILFVINGLPSMDARFRGLGFCLSVVGLILAIAASAEAVARWHRQPVAQDCMSAPKSGEGSKATTSRA